MSEIELFITSRSEVGRIDPAHLRWLLHNFAVIKDDIIEIRKDIDDIGGHGGDLRELEQRVDVLEHDLLALKNQVDQIGDVVGSPGPPGPPGSKGDPGSPGAPGQDMDACAVMFEPGPYSPFQITDEMDCGMTFTNGTM